MVAAVLGPMADDLAAASLAMARRFAAGGRMWCCAPGWPSHAKHVAVEFVHPVIVGKRALPAAPVEAHDLLDTLRSMSVSGDLLVVVGGADDPAVRAALRRAPAWGLASFWLGAGERPEAGAADHVLWLDGEVPAAAFGGGIVLLYHVLWELTHVCFEHPGLLRGEPAGEQASCVTCADEGRLAEVVEAGPGEQAVVRTAAGVEGVDTTLIGTPQVGDLVLVHAGSAVTLLED